MLLAHRSWQVPARDPVLVSRQGRSGRSSRNVDAHDNGRKDNVEAGPLMESGPNATSTPGLKQQEPTRSVRIDTYPLRRRRNLEIDPA
jgi:hypothetical protein